MPEKSLAQEWDSKGYTVVRQLFDPAFVSDLRAICDDALRQWLAEARDYQEAANNTNMAYLTEPRYFVNQPDNLTLLLETIAHERIFTVLDLLDYDHLLFHNTQYFFNPATQTRAGNWHRDSQFDAPDEEIEWSRINSALGIHAHIALLHDENLEIVPGSHTRRDTPDEADIRHRRNGKSANDDAMPNAIRIHLDAGDACFFSAWGIHRGNYIADIPRRTFDVIYGMPVECYTPSPTCFRQPEVLARLSPHARSFFERFVDTYKEKWERGIYDH